MGNLGNSVSFTLELQVESGGTMAFFLYNFMENQGVLWHFFCRISWEIWRKGDMKVRGCPVRGQKGTYTRPHVHSPPTLVPYAHPPPRPHAVTLTRPDTPVLTPRPAPSLYRQMTYIYSRGIHGPLRSPSEEL